MEFGTPTLTQEPVSPVVVNPQQPMVDSNNPVQLSFQPVIDHSVITTSPMVNPDFIESADQRIESRGTDLDFQPVKDGSVAVVTDSKEPFQLGFQPVTNAPISTVVAGNLSDSVKSGIDYQPFKGEISVVPSKSDITGLGQSFIQPALGEVSTGLPTDSTDLNKSFIEPIKPVESSIVKTDIVNPEMSFIEPIQQSNLGVIKTDAVSSEKSFIEPTQLSTQVTTKPTFTAPEIKVGDAPIGTVHYSYEGDYDDMGNVIQGGRIVEVNARPDSAQIMTANIALGNVSKDQMLDIIKSTGATIPSDGRPTTDTFLNYGLRGGDNVQQLMTAFGLNAQDQKVVMNGITAGVLSPIALHEISQQQYVQDIAEQKGVSTTDVRGLLGAGLSAGNLVSAGYGQTSVIDALKPVTTTRVLNSPDSVETKLPEVDLSTTPIKTGPSEAEVAMQDVISSPTGATDTEIALKVAEEARAPKISTVSSYAVDPYSGKEYDVTNPSAPKEVERPTIKLSNVAVDLETGKYFDNTNPLAPKEMTPEPLASPASLAEYQAKYFAAKGWDINRPTEITSNETPNFNMPAIEKLKARDLAMKQGSADYDEKMREATDSYIRTLGLGSYVQSVEANLVTDVGSFAPYVGQFAPMAGSALQPGATKEKVFTPINIGMAVGGTLLYGLDPAAEAIGSKLDTMAANRAAAKMAKGFSPNTTAEPSFGEVFGVEPGLRVENPTPSMEGNAEFIRTPEEMAQLDVSAVETQFTPKELSIQEVPTTPTKLNPLASKLEIVDEPPVQEGYTRLYRGEAGVEQEGTYHVAGEEQLKGNWYSTDKDTALFYAKMNNAADNPAIIKYVDVPTSDVPIYETKIPQLEKNILQKDPNDPMLKGTKVVQTVEEPLNTVDLEGAFTETFNPEPVSSKLMNPPQGESFGELFGVEPGVLTPKVIDAPTPVAKTPTIEAGRPLKTSPTSEQNFGAYPDYNAGGMPEVYGPSTKPDYFGDIPEASGQPTKVMKGMEDDFAAPEYYDPTIEAPDFSRPVRPEDPTASEVTNAFNKPTAESTVKGFIDDAFPEIELTPAKPSSTEGVSSTKLSDSDLEGLFKGTTETPEAPRGGGGTTLEHEAPRSAATMTDEDIQKLIESPSRLGEYEKLKEEGAFGKTAQTEVKPDEQSSVATKVEERPTEKPVDDIYTETNKGSSTVYPEEDLTANYIIDKDGNIVSIRTPRILQPVETTTEIPSTFPELPITPPVVPFIVPPIVEPKEPSAPEISPVTPVEPNAPSETPGKTSPSTDNPFIINPITEPDKTPSPSTTENPDTKTTPTPYNYPITPYVPKQEGGVIIKDRIYGEGPQPWTFPIVDLRTKPKPPPNPPPPEIKPPPDYPTPPEEKRPPPPVDRKPIIIPPKHGKPGGLGDSAGKGSPKKKKSLYKKKFGMTKDMVVYMPTWTGLNTGSLMNRDVTVVTPKKRITEGMTEQNYYLGRRTLNHDVGSVL